MSEVQYRRSYGRDKNFGPHILGPKMRPILGPNWDPKLGPYIETTPKPVQGGTK